MNVVFSPRPDEKYFPSVADALKRIFRRLHSLLAVCSTWRKVGIALGQLWCVIPATEGISNYPSLEAASLAIQRSGNHPLHLAAVLSHHYDPAPPFLSSTIPQFTSINIATQFMASTPDISRMLKGLIRSQSPSVLSELSIHQYEPHMDDSPLQPPKSNEFIDSSMSAQHRDRLTTLIGSLSALRLRGVYIHWETITFSDKLVEFHLQSVVLGNTAQLAKLLQAIGSAQQLRDLRLVSVVAFADRSETLNAQQTISLPKLQSLLLENLSFNVLKQVLTSIAPGSHQIKVALTPRSERTHFRSDHSDSDESVDEFLDDEFGFGEGGVVSKSVLDLLASSNVHTILLDAHKREAPWVQAPKLRSLLRSLPSLKTLIMVSWKWDLGAIRALERPDSGSFPNLEGLCIVGGYITDSNRLPHEVATHSLQTMILDSHPGTLVGGDRGQIARLLKRVVPDFRLVRGLEQMDEFNYDSWRLW
ncbi:hypothetical protein RSOL_362260 [Rhizoctonia solani AG-3 Rhs1AP]|nr:hypothetical protein RSOL_362260 [Rhizoctonia solani AG-3 Rhs1AP]